MSTELPSSGSDPRSGSVTPPQPYWRNSPNDPDIRNYSFNDAQLEVDGDELRVLVRRAPWKFLIGFACLFIPAFSFAAWYFIPDPIRWPFVIMGPVVGCFTFGMLFWLLSHHEGLGDFLVIDRAARTVVLPRSKKQFPFDQVVRLQRIRGRTKHDVECDVDLNLLVTESGEVIRHFVTGNTGRRLVDQVVAFSGFGLEEIDLGRRGYRDADKRDAGVR